MSSDAHHTVNQYRLYTLDSDHHNIELLFLDNIKHDMPLHDMHVMYMYIYFIYSYFMYHVNVCQCLHLYVS